MILTQSTFPVFGCVPFKLNYFIIPVHVPNLSPLLFCSCYSLSLQCPHLYCVSTSLLKCISHALDFVKVFLSRRYKNKAPGLMGLEFWLRMGLPTIIKVKTILKHLISDGTSCCDCIR